MRMEDSVQWVGIFYLILDHRIGVTFVISFDQLQVGDYLFHIIISYSKYISINNAYLR